MKQNKMLILALIASLVISLIPLAGCVPPEGAPPEGGGGFGWEIIIFIVLIFGVFYLLMIRPQQKRQKAQRQLMEELRKGDNVITAGGMYGQIESLSEDSVVIKVESGATIRIARGSILGKRGR